MPEPGLSGAIPSALMAQAARNFHDKIALRYGEQSWTFAQFDAIAEEFGFRKIDANRSIREVFGELRREVAAVVSSMKKQQPSASPMPAVLPPRPGTSPDGG